MQQHDEDATLSQLAAAWMHIASGTPKGYGEAASLYEELVDKFGSSLMLLNGIAVANIHMGQFDKAEKVLVDAMTQGQNDPDTLINYITCMQHLNKPPEFTQRYIKYAEPPSPQSPRPSPLPARFLDPCSLVVAMDFAVKSKPRHRTTLMSPGSLLWRGPSSVCLSSSPKKDEGTITW